MFVVLVDESELPLVSLALGEFLELKFLAFRDGSDALSQNRSPPFSRSERSISSGRGSWC